LHHPAVVEQDYPTERTNLIHERTEAIQQQLLVGAKVPPSTDKQ
jgi:hypothetical protein